MSDSGRDWGASSDESIRAFNAAKREAKIKNAIEQLDSLHAATPQGEWSETAPRTSSVESVYCDGERVACCCYGNRETSEPTAKFVARIHNAWPTISDELKRLQAFKIDGMTIDDLNRLRQMMVDATAARSDFEKALDASEERVAELLRENAELKAKLDTEKRAALDIAIAALNTGCVKPESKGTVEAVNDMAAEIERLRDANKMLVGALKIASAECDQLREKLKGKT